MGTRKQIIKQRIAATVVILFMFIMAYGTINIRDLSAATVTNTTLIQNLVAGTLSLEAPTSLGFNNLTVAVAANSLANLDIVNVRDYRGSGAGWSVTATVNELMTSATGVNNITNASVWWTPGAVFALDGASNTGVNLASTNSFDQSDVTLINAAADAGMGNFKVVNTTINIVYNGRPDQLAGTYQATLQMTLQ